jgi:hypothetical protein
MKSSLKTVLLGTVLGVLFCSGWASSQQTVPTPTISPEQQKRLELMKSKSAETSLTILPIRLAGKPFDRVSEIVGLLLERNGLKNIELGKDAFEPTGQPDTQVLATSVGEFVRKHPMTTEYALYAEFNGNPQTGLDELRAAVVDKSGAVVWTGHQTARDIKRRGAEEPMDFCGLLMEDLSPQLGLNEQTAKAAKPGKMARLMDERSGLPPESERAPLPERQKAMKTLAQKATLVVFPVRIGGDAVNEASAADLAKMVNEAGPCKAIVAKQSVLLKASQVDPNELKTLWDLAREFRDFVHKNPPQTDYVLYADYVFNPQHWEQGFVHFIVCDRKGGMGHRGHAELASSRLPEYPTGIPGGLQQASRQTPHRHPSLDSARRRDARGNAAATDAPCQVSFWIH